MMKVARRLEAHRHLELVPILHSAFPEEDHRPRPLELVRPPLELVYWIDHTDALYAITPKSCLTPLVPQKMPLKLSPLHLPGVGYQLPDPSSR